MAEKSLTVARRSFLSRFGAGAATVTAGTFGLLPARAQAAAAGFQPAKHAADDWLDAARGSHRMVIDSSTPEGGGLALLYAANFFTANKAAYDLDPNAIAVVIVLRHFATPFAYSDAIWAKYGAVLSGLVNFTDPQTKAAPMTNLYNSGAYGLALTNFGNTIPAMTQKNVQFAVCNMATRFLAGVIAEKTKGDAEAVYRDLASNLIANSHMVAAGVLATNRAQERGYTFLFAG